MGKFLKGILLAGLLAFGSMALTGCERVEPGNVGIKVNKLGDDKGVGDVVGVGRYWTGLNTDLYIFPTFKQMKTYDAPFNFQLSDGTSITHKVGVAYKVDPTKITTIFQTYRKGVEEITETDLRQKIEDSLNRRGSKMNTDLFIAGGKAALLDGALADLQKEMDPVGIKVLSLSWAGAPGYPDTVKAAINAKVQATQKTLQRQQEVQQSKAEADKKIEEARGESESQILRAEGQAKAIALQGEALRLNPQYLEWMKIDKWSGLLPVYDGSGNSSTMIQFAPQKQTVPASK